MEKIENSSGRIEEKKYGYELKNKLDVYVNTSNGAKKISSITKEHSFNKLLSKIQAGIFTIKDIDKDTLQIKSVYLDKKKYYMDEFLLRLDFFNMIKNGSAGGLLKEISIYELLLDYTLLDLETTKGFDINAIEILKINKKILEDIIFMKDQILFNRGIIVNNNVEMKKRYDNIKSKLDNNISIVLDDNILLIKNSLEKFLKYVINECYSIGLNYYKFIIPRDILKSIKLDNIFFFVNEDEEKKENIYLDDENVGEKIDYKKTIEFIRKRIINKEYYSEVELFCKESGENINDMYINEFIWFGSMLGIDNDKYKKNVNYLFNKEKVVLENNNKNKEKYYQNKDSSYDNENDILDRNRFISKITEPNTYNLIKFKNGYLDKSILLHLISKTNFIYNENGEIINKIYPYINKEIYNKKDLLLTLNSNIDKINKNEDDINILIDIIFKGKSINELIRYSDYNELAKNIIYYSKDLSEIDYVFGPYTYELLKESFKYCENKFNESVIKIPKGVLNIYKTLEIIKDEKNQIEIFNDIKKRINNFNNISIEEAFIPIVNIITNFIKLLEEKLEVKDLEEISIYGISLNLLSDIELKKIMKINLRMLKEINDKGIFNDKFLINPLQIGKSKNLFLLGKTGSGKSLRFNKFIDSYNTTNNTIIYFNTVKDRDINIKIDKIINNVDEFVKFDFNEYIGRKILIDINFSKIINDNDEKLNSVIINKMVKIRSIGNSYDIKNNFSNLILAIPDFTIISILFNNNEEKLNNFISGGVNGNILISDSLINLDLFKNLLIQNIITFGLDYNIIEKIIKNNYNGFDTSDLNYTSFLYSYFIFRKNNGELTSKKILFLDY